MSDTTNETNLPYGNTVVPGTSIRDQDFEHAALLGVKRSAAPGVGSLLLGLALLLIGVICFFAALRVLFDPHIVGGPGLVVVLIPLAIIATIASLFFGSRILIKRAQHLRHG